MRRLKKKIKKVQNKFVITKYSCRFVITNRKDIMKTIKIGNKEYQAIQPNGMSDKAFISMVVRNDMVKGKVNAFANSLNR